MQKSLRMRLGSLFLALIMLLSLLPATALAEDAAAPLEVQTEEALLAAFEAGGTIKVTAPIKVTAAETVMITKPVVLDLNGRTITWSTSAKEAIKVQKGGDLTIQDAANTGNTGALKFTSTYSSSVHSGICVFTDGSLTITGGRISYDHATQSGRAIYTNSNAAFTMTGGTVSIFGASNYAMYFYGTGPHRITGGELVFDNTTASQVYGIYANGSNVEIDNLTVDGSGIPDTKSVICIRGYNSSTPISISGGTYKANGNEDSYAVGAGSSNKTAISGGTFNGAVKAAVGKITGGVFSVRPPASYITLGKVFELQSDGYYHVKDGSYVAYIGDTGYLTWDELFADASTTTSSSRVYLLSDAAEIVVPAGKNVTFYNSKKLSVEKITNNGTCKILTYAMPGTEIVNNGTLSLDHEVGSLVNNAGGVVNATANSPKVTGDLTNHGTMTISKGSYLGALTNDGTLTITGGTFAQDVKALCAEGYTTQQNKEGTWDVMADVPHVAEIDGYWYGTLQAALSSAKNGNTVKLLSDVTLSSKVSVNNKSLTLDMNRHKITYGASGTTVNTAGALVFGGASDITITGNGSFDFDDTYSAESSKSTGRIFDVNNSSVLTIENGSFRAAMTCILVDNNAKAVVKGGTYSASEPYGSDWFLLNLQDKSEARIQVYGGTFAQYNPAESHTEPGGPVSFCAEGYVVTREEREGVTYYTVGPDSTQAFAAEVGGLKYVSLDKAVEAAEDGDTVTLLQKYDGEPVEISKAITIDLGDTGTASDRFAAGTGYVMAVDGTRILFGTCYTITFDPAGGTVDPETSATVFGGKLSSLPTPTRSGYTFDGWFTEANGGEKITTDTVFTEDTTIYAHWSVISSGGGSSSGNKTETVTNPDGSVTTTVTKPDGSTTETTKQPDGTTTTVVTDKDGNSETTVSLSSKAISEAGDEAIALPMDPVEVTDDQKEAPVITVRLGNGGSALVEIPVDDVTAGTVAVLVNSDGTEEIVMDSVVTEDGVALTVKSGAKVKIVDNSIDFIDVPDTYWGADEIDFVTSRELFNGTSANKFSPENTMTRAMIVTVLARYEGVDTTTGDEWYEAGAAWAVKEGISDGTNLMDAITREQLVTMLYRYAGEPEVTGTVTGFPDAASVSDWAENAMVWALENDLINGMTDGTLKPQGTATRAQVAAILARFVANVG